MLENSNITTSPARVVRILITLLLLTTLAAKPNTTHAAALVVTRFDDPAPNSCQPGDCSLREAIIAANTTTGRDTIALAPGTYTLSIAGMSEDAAAAGDLDIAGDITLTGAGAGATAIDANQIDRVLDIRSGDVRISGITLQHGAAGSGNNGGGIRNAGTLALAASAVVSSTAGVFLDFGGGVGGGIFSTGALELAGSTISGNTSDAYGGGIYSTGSLTVSSSLLTSNTAGESSGGALATTGVATIRNTLITKNKTYGAGGGINNSGTLALANSQVTYNSANEGQSAGGGIVNSGTLTMTRSLLSQNTIDSTDGGGLFNLGRATVIGSVIEQNTANEGPGVYNFRGELTFLDSTISMSSIGNSGEITATNSTFSRAPITNEGRMVFGNATITNATLAIENSGSVEMRNTILAGNDADCSGPIVSLGHNLVGDVTGCTYTAAPGDLIGTSAQPLDPQLGALQHNGGATATHAPLPASPAVDAGDNVTCALVDQRGVARPQGRACDIGAVEVKQPLRLFIPLIRS